MLRYYTAGESHGEALIAVISGIPAGLPIDQASIDRELWRRQQGFGRGGRMRIEKDHAHIISGVRHGKTIGSPISVLLENKDWKKWEESLPVEPGDPEKHKRVASPRPGHADLAGALKYNFPEARYILERASDLQIPQVKHRDDPNNHERQNNRRTDAENSVKILPKRHSGECNGRRKTNRSRDESGHEPERRMIYL